MTTDSVRWKVPGFYSMDRALLDFFDGIKACGLPAFTDVYGTMPCRWDGGRPIHVKLPANAPLPNFEQYQRKGIKVYLPFNSTQLTTADLDDELANRLLQEADGVIIASPLLNSYIRDNYPKVSRTASCIQSIMLNKNKTLDHYTRLCDEYDRVVIGTTHLFNSDPKRSLDLKFIDQLDRDKIEIMVNDDCVFDCPHKAGHYAAMAMHNKTQTLESAQQAARFAQLHCRKGLVIKGKVIDLILGNTMVATLKEMGFRHFKMVGRSFPGAYTLNEIVRYIIPERMQPLLSIDLAQILHRSAINSFIPLLQSHMKMALESASKPPASELERQTIASFTPVLQSYLNKALGIVYSNLNVPEAKQ